MYGLGMQHSGQGYSDAINALANAYNIRAQGQMAQQQQPFELLKILTAFA